MNVEIILKIVFIYTSPYSMLTKISCLRETL